MREQESVAVIVPTFNSEKNISRLITSVYNQDYQPIEVIVVDGASTDGTVSAVRELASKLNSESFRICILREEDYGNHRSPANARNIGISNSISNYILLFDSDFELTERTLVSHLKAELEKYPCVGAKVVPKIDTWLELHCAIDEFRRDLSSNVHTYCGYRREILEKTMFDPELGFGEDRDLHARLGILPVYVDATCSRHLIHTFGQWRRQAFWYGKTFPRFLRKYWRTIDPRRFWINPLAQLAWRTANLSLLALSIVGIFLSPVLSIVALVLFLVRLIYLYVRSASRKSYRLVYLLLRETYYAFWFVTGLLTSFIGRSARGLTH